MFLAIDIGNTTASFGIFAGRKYLNGFRLQSHIAIDKAELGKAMSANIDSVLPANEVIQGIGISSVVPEITQRYIEIAEKNHKVTSRLLRADRDYGFKIGYDEPGQLGSDRLANIIAARELYGFPAIIIDMGTATKIELLDTDGNYIGGAIAPGLAISAQALFERASQLYPVTFSKPKGLLGTNTTDCLKSGIYYGVLGQLTALIAKIKVQFGISELKVIGTGGLIDVYENEPGLFTDIDKELTLRGLQVALDK